MIRNELSMDHLFNLKLRIHVPVTMIYPISWSVFLLMVWAQRFHVLLKICGFEILKGDDPFCRSIEDYPTKLLIQRSIYNQQSWLSTPNAIEFRVWWHRKSHLQNTVSKTIPHLTPWCWYYVVCRAHRYCLIIGGSS